MSNAEFLEWLANRLVEVYGEHPDTDFVQKLRAVVSQVEHDEYRIRELEK